MVLDSRVQKDPEILSAQETIAGAAVRLLPEPRESTSWARASGSAALLVLALWTAGALCRLRTGASARAIDRTFEGVNGAEGPRGDLPLQTYDRAQGAFYHVTARIHHKFGQLSFPEKVRNQKDLATGQKGDSGS